MVIVDNFCLLFGRNVSLVFCVFEVDFVCVMQELRYPVLACNLGKVLEIPDKRPSHVSDKNLQMSASTRYPNGRLTGPTLTGPVPCTPSPFTPHLLSARNLPLSVALTFHCNDISPCSSPHPSTSFHACNLTCIDNHTRTQDLLSLAPDQYAVRGRRYSTELHALFDLPSIGMG
jgi:hypothetical protein